MNTTFIEALTLAFTNKKNSDNAIPMGKYMKNHFPFLGIKTTERRAIFQELWKKHKDEIRINYREIAWELYLKNEREFHYCGIEILTKEIKKEYKKEDILLIEKFIVTHSWWDSVDTIAKFTLGNYLLAFPQETLKVIEQFSNSSSIWLNRSAILFQLSYKEKTNFDLLKSECEKHKHSKEFFIQKAIGWALRDYSRFNPTGVTTYVENTNLKPLSKKEALRNIK